MGRFFFLLSFAFLACISVNGQNSLDDLNVVFKHDFENNTLGDYLYDEWKRDWLYPEWNSRQPTTDIFREATDVANPTKTLQINFPANSLGPDEGGAQWWTKIAKADEIYMSYDILFMPGFEYQMGGKLPSLQGGTVDGDGKPTGYDGFTGGLMFKQDGLIDFYIYYPDSKDPNYGDSFLWGSNGYTADYFLPSSVRIEYGSGTIPYCRPGEWHNITYRMVLNSVKPGGGGNYDGILEAFFDGKLVTQVSHLLFRHTTSLGIDCMRIYSFFGGDNDAWRNPIEEWIRIDNVMLYTFKDNVNVPHGNVLSPTDRTINHWRKLSMTNTQPPAIPGAPNLVSRTKNSITLNWNDNSDNEYGFKIYRSLSSADGYEEIGATAANITSYTNTSLQPGTAYYYKIRSYNDVGFSGYTAALQASTTTLQLPSPPSGLKSNSVDYTRCLIAWNDNSGNETGFEIERGDPDNNTTRVFTTAQNLTTFSDEGLQTNTTYTYRVRAVNSDGKSDYSNTVQITTPYLDPPSAPSALKSTDFTEKSITIAWKDNSDNENGFVISRALATDPMTRVYIVVDANDTSFTDDNLHSSTSYQYTIKAINPAGNSASSNKKVASTLSLAETKRVKDGIIAYYNFNYDPDVIIHDQSEFSEPLDLHVLQPQAVTWNNNNKLVVRSNTALVSYAPARKIIDAVKQTNEITVECWIKPEEPDFTNDSRVLSLAGNDEQIGIVMDQHYASISDKPVLTYGIRMQTGSTNPSGYPEFIPDLAGINHIGLQHLAYTRDSLGHERMYINGIKSSEGYRPSDISTWEDNFYLRFGNENDLNHPWKGTFYSVAIFNKALTYNQLINNYYVGPCDSLEQSSLSFQINVVPNPVTDKAIVEIIPQESGDIVSQTSIRVLDIYGKVYYENILFNPNRLYSEVIDFKQYQKGVYFLQVISGENQKSTKLIVY